MQFPRLFQNSFLHTKRFLKSTISKLEKFHFLGERKKLIFFCTAGSKSPIDMKMFWGNLLDSFFSGRKIFGRTPSQTHIFDHRNFWHHQKLENSKILPKMTQNFKCAIWVPILIPSPFRIFFHKLKGRLWRGFWNKNNFRVLAPFGCTRLTKWQKSWFSAKKRLWPKFLQPPKCTF